VDTVTQALLGAAIGQAGFSGTLGRRAKWWGAAAGLLPDIDVIAAATHGPFGELLYHRGFTHSLWFAFVAGPILAWLVQLVYGRRRRGRIPDTGDYNAWTKLFVLALFTHPLIDWNTTYGTQLFAPFSRERFALNGVGILDPFYSAPLLISLIVGSLGRRRLGVARAALRGQRAAWAGLAISTVYMFYAAALNIRLEGHLTAQFKQAGVQQVTVRSYPTLLQPWLRRVVARTDDQIRIGWATTFAPEATRWKDFDRTEHPLIDALIATPQGQLFNWFAMEETSARVRASRDGFVVEIDDLRYGTPGPPDEGMWGLRAFFDRSGTLRGEIQRFSRPRSFDRLAPTNLFRAAFGDLGALEQ